MSYTLYNKKINKKLTHPLFGVWATADLNEAKEMLKSCFEYIDAAGLNILKSDFIIIDVENNNEIQS